MSNRVVYYDATGTQDKAVQVMEATENSGCREQHVVFRSKHRTKGTTLYMLMRSEGVC